MRRAHDYRELLRAGHWFRDLPEALATRLLDGAVIREHAAGTTILGRGDPPSGLHAVVVGAVRLSGRTDDDRELLHMLVEPPGWFGELSLADGGPRAHDAFADQDTVLVDVPQDALVTILDEEPMLWREIARLVAKRLRLASQALEDLATATPTVRLARRILLMSHGYGEWRQRTRRVIELRQSQLAAMVNVSRQTVNQTLRGFEAQGVVRISYGQIEVLDEEALRSIALLEQL